MAYSYNGVTIEQIHRRFFPTASPNAYYRRIRKLVQAEYLQIRRAWSLSPFGSPLGLITLGRRARPMLSELLGLPRNELTRATRAVSPFIVPHRGAIGDFRLGLELAVGADPSVELVEWRSEVELASSPIVIADNKKAKIIPDGQFTLSTPGGSLTAYLEMDMGTIGTRLRTNLRAYLLHRRSLAAPHPILYVVSDERRQQTIANWVLLEAQAERADPTIFLITVRARVSEHTLLHAPIWQVVAGPQAQALLPGFSPAQPAYLTHGQVLERQVH
jgi:hypothetical protein